MSTENGFYLFYKASLRYSPTLESVSEVSLEGSNATSHIFRLASRDRARGEIDIPSEIAQVATVAARCDDYK